MEGVGGVCARVHGLHAADERARERMRHGILTYVHVSYMHVYVSYIHVYVSYIHVYVSYIHVQPICTGAASSGGDGNEGDASPEARALSPNLDASPGDLLRRIKLIKFKI
jgi:hypothetical protein